VLKSFGHLARQHRTKNLSLKNVGYGRTTLITSGLQRTLSNSFPVERFWALKSRSYNRKNGSSLIYCLPHDCDKLKNSILKFTFFLSFFLSHPTQCFQRNFADPSSMLDACHKEPGKYVLARHQSPDWRTRGHGFHTNRELWFFFFVLCSWQTEYPVFLKKGLD